jgi:hypothetical protein
MEPSFPQQDLHDVSLKSSSSESSELQGEDKDMVDLHIRDDPQSEEALQEAVSEEVSKQTEVDQNESPTVPPDTLNASKEPSPAKPIEEVLKPSLEEEESSVPYRQTQDESVPVTVMHERSSLRNSMASNRIETGESNCKCSLV